MPHKDPVTDLVRRSVIKRDGGCVGLKLNMPRQCGTQFGEGTKGAIEIDHVVSGGLGRRGPSAEKNLVSICGIHHRVKTESSKLWRAKIIEYLENYYGQND